MRDLSSGDHRIYLELEVRRVDCRRCGAVKRERLDFLGDNPFYTKRFAYYVGRRCRSTTIKELAEELTLHWHTVKELEKQYMHAQLVRAGTPGPRRIGIDEISIRKRHTYRIVVSDLDRRRAIWFGGDDRSEASMAQFYAWLGEKKRRRIKLALMDMWKPFRDASRSMEALPGRLAVAVVAAYRLIEDSDLDNYWMRTLMAAASYDPRGVFVIGDESSCENPGTACGWA